MQSPPTSTATNDSTGGTKAHTSTRTSQDSSPPSRLGDLLKSPTGARGSPYALNPELVAQHEANRIKAEAAEKARADKARKERAIALWTASGVDKRHRMRKYEDLAKHQRWAETFDAGMEVVSNGGIIALLGDRGNGKTQCGVEMVRRFCRQLHPCLYVRSREIGMKLREAFRSDTIKERDQVEFFVKPQLLVIDEAQEKPDSDFEQRSLTLILDRRYGEMKPTVIIANLDEPEFRRLVGVSVVDRIREGGGILMFDWPSFRLTKPEGEHGPNI
jgi:DNA replication protein DnaC